MNAPTKPKLKKCKVCGESFMPRNTLQPTCYKFECQFTYADAHALKAVEKRAKVERKAHREAKQKIKTRGQWMKEAQIEFNRYIRLRDAALPCISCGRFHTGQYHAGHYLTVGARPELRFCELNVHKQCSACNNHLSGNIVAYRMALVGRIGLDKVDWLEGKHEPLKLTIEQIKEIKEKYKLKCKELMKKHEALA